MRYHTLKKHDVHTPCQPLFVEFLHFVFFIEIQTGVWLQHKYMTDENRENNNELSYLTKFKEYSQWFTSSHE